MLRGDYEVLSELKGKDMVGWTYDGPFDELPAEQQKGGYHPLEEIGVLVQKRSAKEAHRVIPWNEVGEAEGTGIVHIAPGCGAEDFALSKEFDLPVVAPLDDESKFLNGFGWLSGRPVAEVAPPIFDDLERKGILYAVEPYSHRYPTCWRCGTELVFRLVDEWFISMGELYDKPREEVTPEKRNEACATRSWMSWIRSGGYQTSDWPRARLAPQHARLDDQQEALLRPGIAILGV